MKKRLALVLCAAMLISLFIPSIASAATYNLVEHQKYMNVYKIDASKRLAAPDQAITRGELANVLYNLYNGNTKNFNPATAPSFSDVPSDYEYYKQITFLASKEYLQGFTDGTFRPEKSLTRAEFAQVLTRFKKLTANSPILKAPDIEGHWAQNPINAVMLRGYMKGYPDGQFKPENTLTRAEVAATINRNYTRVPNVSKRLANVHLVTDIRNGLISVYNFTEVFPDLPLKHWAYADMMEACISHVMIYDDVSKCEVWLKEITN